MRSPLKQKRKVVFCVPFLEKPTKPFVASLEASLPIIEEAGWIHELAHEQGCAYISAARNNMLRRALDAKADVIMFLDYDVAWRPEDMLKILETKQHVVAGLYRYKTDDVEYMGQFSDDVPACNTEGLIRAKFVPAGFLKMTRNAVSLFAKQHPYLLYGDPMHPHLDIFSHGAIEGVWYGEDYAFSMRWNQTGENLWVCPDLSLDHYDKDGKCYKGNFHEYMIKGDFHESKTEDVWG